MPNIFDGLEKMDDEKLRYQIATLETVTISNVTSEMGQKAGKGTIKFVNSIRGMFNGGKYAEPEVVSIEDRITLAKQNLEKMDRVRLNARMKKLLIDKVKAAGNIIDPNPSDDVISVAVIETAAKRYKNEISEELTSDQKADAIRHRYNEVLMEQTRKNLENQTEEQKKETEEELQKEINNMTDNQQKELKEALGIDVLTGSAVRQMLTTTAGTAAAMLVLDVSGFGAYMALTTIMHAIFTTTLGITLPFAAYTGATSVLAFITGPVGWIALLGAQAFMINNSKNKLIYELMAQVVWGSTVAYITSNEEAQEEINKLRQEMHESTDKEQQAQKNVEKYKKLLFDKEKELASQKNLSKEQMEKRKEEIKEYEKLAESSEEEKVKAQKEKEQLNEQLNLIKDKLQKVQKSATQKTEKRTKELKQRWNKLFPKLEFASGSIKDVNKDFENNEFVYIEKVLIDISGAEDPHTLRSNRGKMRNSSEADHIGFSIPSYHDCRVFYKLIKGNTNEKKVLITKIVKHNYSLYGK